MTRVLTERELNRALLARQLLLERAKTPLPRALERIGGIQAQYAPSMYIGLWSRLEGFERDQLTRALKRKTVVQGTLMRTTIHLVSKRDYWPFTVGIRRRRREHWVRAHKADRKKIEAAARKAKPHLAKEPLSQSELDALLQADAATRNGVGLFLDLIRVPPSGTWERRRADIYALAEEWVGPENTTEKEGIELLVRRYLTGFGPARPDEIAGWAGVSKPDVTAALEAIDLRRFEDEQGKELVDLPRLPLPDEDTPAPVRFLPVWDATLLAHARRTQVLPERYRSRVFNARTPHSVNTFLVDGQVAGTWRFEKGRVKTQPFGRLPKGARAELDEEAERLAAFHA
ncbi:MAG: winged helix DNA-binding domain-containing protein [Actinobacteria bacterium]|nr:MAG: winged helix DNA-binding domain-containing protein [Actinomycetota bacterium]